MPKQEQAQSPNGVQLQSRKVNKGRLQVKELSGGKRQRRQAIFAAEVTKASADAATRQFADERNSISATRVISNMVHSELAIKKSAHVRFETSAKPGT